MNSHHPHKSHISPAMFALIASSAIWGATGPIMKLTLQSVPIFSLAFIRFFCAAIILLPFVFNKLHIARKDITLLLLTSLFGVTINIAFFFWGVTLTSALNAGIIISSAPIFTLVIAHYLLRERITQNLEIGAILGMAGIGLVIGKGVFSSGISISPIGDILIIIATIAFVFYEIMSKKLFAAYNPFVISFYSFLIGAFSFLPTAFLEYSTNPAWIFHIKTSAVLGILYGIFFSSLCAYSLWEWGLSKISASRVGFFLYIDPIVSTIVSLWLFSDTLSPFFVIGSILIFSGLILTQGYIPYHPRVFRKNA